MKIVYSAEADANLHEILDYGVKNWGIEPAIRFTEYLQDEISILMGFPELGKLYQNVYIKRSQGLRAFDIDNYKTIYRLSGDDIEIISILPKGRPLLLAEPKSPSPPL